MENRNKLNKNELNDCRYLWGILSFVGYLASLITLIACHKTITAHQQLYILMAWLAVDTVFGFIMCSIGKHKSMIDERSENYTEWIWEEPEYDSKKLRFEERIGA